MVLDNDLTKSYIKIIEDIVLQDKDFKSSYECNGIKVPRVTSVLGRTIHDDFLMYWANSLGFKRQSYRKVLNHAANIGTEVHNYLAKLITNSPNIEPGHDLMQESVNCIESFETWWRMLNDKHKVTVLGSEKTLTCPYFGGTYDLLLSVDDRIFLMDFKTSNQVSFKYFLQLAAYRYLLWYCEGIEVDGFTILRMDKRDSAFEVVHCDMNIPEQAEFMEYCHQMFFSLLTSYNYILNMENKFKDIYKELKWSNAF